MFRGRNPKDPPPPKRFLVGCGSLFVRPEHLTALRAWCRRYLPGRWKPDVLRPGIAGMQGSVAIRLRPCMIRSTYRGVPHGFNGEPRSLINPSYEAGGAMILLCLFFVVLKCRGRLFFVAWCSLNRSRFFLPGCDARQGRNDTTSKARQTTSEVVLCVRKRVNEWSGVTSVFFFVLCGVG
ncbi:unnamed protein product [Laminaria digitata]